MQALKPISMNTNEIAQYLSQHPEFFEEHVELLAKIKLTSPVMGKTISLQERQMEVVREKLKAMELRLSELVRLAQLNDEISKKQQTWTSSLLQARNDVDLPHILTSALQEIFTLPYATLRLWGVDEAYSHTWFAEPVSEDLQLFAKGLQVPFCGKNKDFEAASWIADEVQSLAMLPLRLNPQAETFGLLVLGSPDAARFTSEMATDFLSKLADTSSAALYCMVA